MTDNNLNIKGKICAHLSLSSLISWALQANPPPKTMSAKIGDVGYTFRKQFNEGWFVGRVVKIRLGAGELRNFLVSLRFCLCD